MKVKELRAGQGKVDVEVKVKSKADIKVMQKYGRELKVANAVVADDSGEIKMSLWNEDADKVKAGDVIKITNGYVSEFNGEKQLTSGKYGSLEIVAPASPSSDSEVVEKKEMNNKVVAKKDVDEESIDEVEDDLAEKDSEVEDAEEDFEDKEF